MYLLQLIPVWVGLKGHGNEADFLGFLQKLGPHRSLTLSFEPIRFWLRIRGDIRNRKMTPWLGKSVSRRLSDSGSRWLSDSASRGVDDSPTRRVRESAFKCLKEKLGESESRRLPVSPNLGVTNSPTQRVGESSTPWLGESGSRHGESGSRYSNFLKFSIDFPDFKRLNQPIKRSIWQKRSQRCDVLLPLIYLKVWKIFYLKAFLSTPRLCESGSRFLITNISANTKPKSERLEM